VAERGEIHWAELGRAVGSEPAKLRPVLVIQADAFNRSRLATVVVASISSRTGLAEYPGNVFLPATASGLPRDSVVNVMALATVDRAILTARVGELPAYLLADVDRGLRLLLEL
jgi:mRNA interferase MazF